MILAHNVNPCFTSSMLPATLPLQSLKVLEACARAGNFTRAASELGVTTTAVSQRIRELEQTLGVQLFRRNGPRVALTEAGEVLGAGVTKGLAVIAEAVAASSAANAKLRVTSTPTFANQWLIPQLARYQVAEESCPVLLDVSTDRRAPQDFDVAIRSGPQPEPTCDATELFRMDVIPMLSPQLAARLSDDPASLKEVPLIPDDRWRHWFEAAGVSASTLSFVGFDFPTQDASAGAAHQGLGAALLCPIMFAEELRSGRLVAPFETRLQGTASYWLLWRQEYAQSSFVEWIAQEFRSSPKAGGAVRRRGA
jgi:LysR family transcriptional regulator, glycine cleavage system transcriptional activator